MTTRKELIEAVYAAIEQCIGHRFTQDFYRTLDELITLLDDGGEPPE